MTTHQCTRCSKNFQIDDQELVFYKTMAVPMPQQCPQCRLVRRLLERNARVLYRRKCDFSGQTIISQFHQNQPFPVYDQKIWWSDQWDALDYGRDYDFFRPFFEQFRELTQVVPHMSVFIIGGTMENSDYTNCAGYLKNCYMVSEADYNEDCYYSNRLFHNNKDLIDCSDCYHNELCYECVNCRDCYHVLYSQQSQNCADSYFLYDCMDCKNCIGCTNQRHQQYKIFNKQYTPEEYERIKAKYQLHTRSGVERLRQESRTFWASQIHRHLQAEYNVDSFGDHLYHSKNATYCFDATKLENCKYCVKILEAKDCMDYTSWGIYAELVYNSASCGDHVYNLKCCSTCTTNVSNAEYSYLCTASADIFGCVGLKKQQYCILNKQYSKSDYEQLKAKIIAQMKASGDYGNFFPLDICPFAYNETIAMDYFPLTQQQAEQQGYRWYEEDKPSTVQLQPLEEAIDTVPDTIVERVLTCAACQKNYKIIQQELDFYRRLKIPVPNRCYSCRHQQRLQQRNPIELWQRQCMCTQPNHQHHGQCATRVETNFAPDRKEIIYCSPCYQKEVY